MSREITPAQIAKAISDLLEENEKLKEKYLNSVCDYEAEKSENQQLQERIDKAIEYIDEYRFDLELPSRQEELLEILKGENNETN